MMIKQYVVDAFTERIFAGNPAAVCVMEEWLSDSVMMNIARENNLSETAFVVKEGAWHLRWFTPVGEIDLCGHATLAAAFVILNYYDLKAKEVCFDTMSGRLTVTEKGERYEMDFPTYELRKVEVTPEITQAIGAEPVEAYMGRDLLCVMKDADTVRALSPDMEKVVELDGLLLQVTAPFHEEGYDCISRSFAPKLRINEDPVCGSGHCHIVPYWSCRNGSDEIKAYQASRRGGTLWCRMDRDRVRISGSAALFSIAELYI